MIAAGRRPVGRAPVPVELHPHVIRARRAVDAALAEQPTQPATASSAATRKAEWPATAKPVGNTTDPRSRLMPTRCGFVQGFNAQVAVTAGQIIVALQVGQSPNDQASFVPMMHAAQAVAEHLHHRTGDPRHVIGTVLADAGYASDANLAEPGPDRLIALGKARDQARGARTAPTTGSPPPEATPRQQMDQQLRTAEGAELYKRRGATVEPGIENLKKIIDRFSRRGLDAVTSEIHLAATAFNILKIHRTAHR